jgi:hypothetical protein
LDDIKLASTKPVIYLSKAAGPVAIACAKDLMKLIEDNNVQLTIITLADHMEIGIAISDYLAPMDMPKSEIEEKKSEDTAKISAILKEID